MTDSKSKSSNVVALKTAKKAEKCPICSKKTVERFAPFCSKRCSDLDLGKWLGEGYRIPSQEVAGFEESFEEED